MRTNITVGTGRARRVFLTVWLVLSGMMAGAGSRLHPADIRLWPVEEGGALPEGIDHWDQLPGPAASEVTDPSATELITLSAPYPTVGSRLRIVTSQAGLHQLSAGHIAERLEGVTEADVRQSILECNYALSRDGQSVAWLAESDGSALLFVAEAYRDTYTDRNVYWLDAGPGLAMAWVDAATNEVADDPGYDETFVDERNLLFVPWTGPEAGDDHWVWTGYRLEGGMTQVVWHAEQSLPDRHPDVVEAHVTVRLVGYYDGPSEVDHRAILYGEGQRLDDLQWPGMSLAAPSGWVTNLTRDAVTVTVDFRREPGVKVSTVLIDAIEVQYGRRLLARDNVLVFEPLPGSNTATVRGFTVPDIRVFDLTDPRQPVLVAATVAAEDSATYRVSWSVDPMAPGRFLAAATAVEPERIEGVSDSGWDEPMEGFRHLVIAPRSLSDTACSLVDHRNAQGLSSQLVPLEELYDTFAWGRRDPRAIRSFLKQAVDAWGLPPRYVCLIGDGHLDVYDHFNQSETRPNYLPPIIERLPNQSLSYEWIVLGLDVPFTDGIEASLRPAVGRLPAQTPAQLQHMIDKIKDYETGHAWKTNVLMVADQDAQHVFARANDRLQERIPEDFQVERLDWAYTSLETSITQARQQLIQAVNDGVPLSVYLGHGNAFSIGSNIIRYSAAYNDLPSLNVPVALPVWLAGTCHLNRFDRPNPTDRCIGKGLLGLSPGGAVAVWSSAAEMYLATAEAATAAALDALFATRETRLGDVLHPANAVIENSHRPWLARVMILLGDPGLRIAPRLSGYDEWRVRNFDPPEDTDDLVSGPYAIFASTGVSNFQRFASGSDEGVVLWPSIRQAVFDGLTLAFPRAAFARRRWTDDVSWHWEATDNLVTGSWQTVDGAIDVVRRTLLDADREWVEVELAAPLAPARFLRVRLQHDFNNP